MSKERLETLYKELLAKAKQVPFLSTEDERIDAQLCLLEEMLESLEH